MSRPPVELILIKLGRISTSKILNMQLSSLSLFAHLRLSWILPNSFCSGLNKQLFVIFRLITAYVLPPDQCIDMLIKVDIKKIRFCVI